MKIYIVTNFPFHDNEITFGAYSSKEKAMEVINNWIEDGMWGTPSRVLAVDIDSAPSRETEIVYCKEE